MRKYFDKKLVMTKEDHKNLETSTKWWIWDNTFVTGDVEVGDNFHVTRNYRAAVHRDCHINVSLKYKIPIVFHNLTNYDADLGKFHFKINVIPNGIEKAMGFSLGIKFVFIDSFQFLNF